MAAERHTPYYEAVLQSARQHATAEERQRAEALRQAMLPRYGDAHAASRAERRYRYARAALTADEVYGAQICIAGITSRQVAAPPRPRSNGPLLTDGDVCPDSVPVDFVAKRLDDYADALLDGWTGHVRVGAPQPTEGPGR